MYVLLGITELGCVPSMKPNHKKLFDRHRVLNNSCQTTMVSAHKIRPFNQHMTTTPSAHKLYSALRVQR